MKGQSKLIRLLIRASLGGLLFSFLSLSASAAPTFTVNSVVDAVASAPLTNGVCETAPGNGTCTLRAAIMKANHFPGGGVKIVIPAAICSLTIPPTGADDELTGDLNITNKVTIVGKAAATTIIDANKIDRVITIATGTTVSIANLTMRNGSATGSGGGLSNNGTLSLTNVIISGNKSSLGSAAGGLLNFGSAVLTNTVVTGNQAGGNAGGIYNDSNLVLNSSTVTDNLTLSGGYGGGILSNGNMTLTKSVVSGNRTLQGSDLATSGKGGGIAQFGGTLTLLNSTISNNSSLSDGGGIYNLATVFTYFSTIAGNLADNNGLGNGTGGGIYNTGTVNLKTTLVGQNYAGTTLNDFNGTINSADYNLIQTTAGSTINGATTHNITGFDPVIDSLKNNGGTTLTRGLFQSSPAINKVPVAQCTDQFGAPLTVDQRGSPRPSGSACDIGAYEGSLTLSLYNRNLIRNGDAEDVAGSPTGSVVATPHWHLGSGQFTAVPYNSAGGFPNVTTNIVPVSHGFNFFFGGNSAVSLADQTLDLTSIGAAIDAGKQRYLFSADFGGFATDADAASVKLTFLSGGMTTIGSAITVGPFPSSDRGTATGFRNHNTGGLFPAGTRFLRVDITMARSAGIANDAYLDNLSLLIPSAQLLNVSSRLLVQTGDNVLIAGFIVTGNGTKKVLLRGIGPSLSAHISGVLADPVLELHEPGGIVVTNDNWRTSQQAAIQATGAAPTNDLESAIVATLAPGTYSAVLRGKSNGTGIGVVEAYDLGQLVPSQLANISTRGFVETGDNVLIGGLIVGPTGGQARKMLFRAIGPSLSSSGIAHPLADPTLELHNGNGAIIAFNDNWKTSQQTAIEATTIPPKNDKESAILATLAPGKYSAIVRGRGNTTGVALVEVYSLN